MVETTAEANEQAAEYMTTVVMHSDGRFQYFILGEVPRVVNYYFLEWLKGEFKNSEVSLLLQACYEDRYGKFDAAISPKLGYGQCTYKYGQGELVSSRSGTSKDNRTRLGNVDCLHLNSIMLWR